MEINPAPFEVGEPPPFARYGPRPEAKGLELIVDKAGEPSFSSSRTRHASTRCSRTW